MAVPISWYEQGIVECGEKIGLLIAGEVYVSSAMDAIAPGDWYVIQPDGVWLPIYADLPEWHAPFKGLSTTGRIWSVTALQEAWTERAGR